ncbi:MAG: efflux RND transporter periplasmic adaptor subunit [Proteobacteria bacterium]|nr:efflux RND transporter periplasmic adaptor subunit [Pseudomonadota bacterium]
MRRWRLRIAAAVVALLALWYFAAPVLLGPVVAVDPVIRATFVQSVVASGHVEAPFRVSIASQITGVVADVPVAEGQSVKAGDTLVVLDDREARAAVVQLEGAVAQAEARMRQLKEFTLPSAEEGLRQAQATLLNAEQVFERTAKLAKDGVATKASLDDATRARDVANAQVRNAELQVYTNRPGGSDYVMAETLLNQARANLDAVRSRLSYTVIKAPRDGVLISRSVERGNVVQPSMVLMQLSPFVDTQLVVQVDEKNLGLLRIGQKAIASADAYPKASFPAEVVYINPGIDLQRASVQVKLRVVSSPSYLLQDMTVSVDIETNRKPDTLIVPLADIRAASAAQPAVLVVRGRRIQRQAVKLGLTGGGKAEILEGLGQGDLVVPLTGSVKEGMRVRTKVAEQKAAP